MRGQFTLFNDYVETEVTTRNVKGHGRDPDLFAARNEALMYRYYYLTRILKLQYQHSLEELASHFYLSIYTVIEILQDNEGKLRQIMREESSKAMLAKRFPHFRW